MIWEEGTQGATPRPRTLRDPRVGEVALGGAHGSEEEATEYKKVARSSKYLSISCGTYKG